MEGRLRALAVPRHLLPPSRWPGGRAAQGAPIARRGSRSRSLHLGRMAVTEVPSNLADFAFPVGEFRAKRVANAGLPLAHLRSRYRRSLATPFLIVFAATPSFAANASKQAGHCDAGHRDQPRRAGEVAKGPHSSSAPQFGPPTGREPFARPRKLETREVLALTGGVSLTRHHCNAGWQQERADTAPRHGAHIYPIHFVTALPTSGARVFGA